MISRIFYQETIKKIPTRYCFCFGLRVILLNESRLNRKSTPGVIAGKFLHKLKSFVNRDNFLNTKLSVYKFFITFSVLVYLAHCGILKDVLSFIFYNIRKLFLCSKYSVCNYYVPDRFLGRKSLKIRKLLN